jgi:hypothetical protein
MFSAIIFTARNTPESLVIPPMPEKNVILAHSEEIKEEQTEVVPPSISVPVPSVITPVASEPTPNHNQLVISMALRLCINEEQTEIKFEYNLGSDTADNVAREMASGFQLSDDLYLEIRNLLEQAGTVKNICLLSFFS